MNFHLPTLLMFACLLGLAMPAVAQKAKPVASFEGRVVRVVDGATLVLRLADKTEQTVRLRNVDAPETCQPGGAESTQALVDMALGKSVRVSQAQRSTAGMLVVAVALDDADLSRRQVEEGHAWSVRFRYDNGPLVKEERMARALRRGFHASGQTELPADFRRRHGPCVTGEAARPASPQATTPTAPAPAPAALYRCDGRTRCTQMSSCDEAKYFLKNCPSTAMDGDNDGLPCEEQWCR